MLMNIALSRKEEIMAINAGEFGVFPGKVRHNIEVMTDDTYLTSTFCRAGSTDERGDPHEKSFTPERIIRESYRHRHGHE